MLPPVYWAFDLQEEFERLGIDVDVETAAGRVSPGEVYGWRPLQGSLVLPSGKAGCEFVARAIRGALERALGGPCVDELGLARQRGAGRPFYGMLRYTQHGIRGKVFVWLFPDESETRISYAILLQEEEAAGSVKKVVTSMAL
jgi:hypothetical protein